MPTDPPDSGGSSSTGAMTDKVIGFSMRNLLVIALVTIGLAAYGFMTAPFDWKEGFLPRDPVAVDAIPDIGENQQIIFTEWPGRSPQDIEDQVTYPLTTALLGVPGVKTIRSQSVFGFSSIFVIFEEGVDFYWSRSRILEKLNSLPAGTLPEGVQPALGPDATPLGQVFWYTLEGRDNEGNVTGGWDLQELRSVQDWIVRYALQSVPGVSEVASVGGFVKEYQIDVDPDAMRAYGVTLDQIFNAVRQSNVDVGARTIEINKAEYVIRGLGFIKSPEDIEQTVIIAPDNTPIRIEQVANVTLGPALRRGALDKEGAEAVGGVVTVRYGANPLDVIQRVKDKLKQIQPGLPKKTLADGTVSQITVVPFYDRTGLIHETLGTLNEALSLEILITIVVVLVMMLHLRSSLLISLMLPLTVLSVFILMKQFGVDANIVALSGIAIAIGTIVDMGIVMCENILRRLEEAPPGADTRKVVYDAACEVGGAVLTAVATTVVGFLPVFAMEGPEGKLFRPLAFTKTFALIASIVIALTILPPLAHALFARKGKLDAWRNLITLGLVVLGIALPSLISWVPWWAGALLVLIAAWRFVEPRIPKQYEPHVPLITGLGLAFVVTVGLSFYWAPLGPQSGILNALFVVAVIAGILGGFWIFQQRYEPILRWCLAHRARFFSIVGAVIAWGALAWLGVGTVFFFVPDLLRQNPVWRAAYHAFPGLGKEFMPPLDEGSYLYMPTTMPHASIGEAMDIMRKQDMAFTAIPEIESAVGKLGRAESPLDPAPISMFETVINYKPEYILNESGERQNFRYSWWSGEFERDENGELIPDEHGRPYRQWRDHIRSPQDIWDEIVVAGQIPGATSAPKLQPIAARIVMLQSGMRAPMGVKIYGNDLKTIERVGFEIEKFLKQVPSIQPETVVADRIVGKPYIEVDIDREAIARYGISIRDVQDVIEVAIGGKRLTTTVEGRERYPVRVRYLRELRDNIESLERILVPAADGAQIPLGQLAEFIYEPGPQMIRSEDTFLVGYVTFDKRPDAAEVDVVETAQRYLNEKQVSGEFDVPAGMSYKFAGSYENQVRAEKRLRIILPLALFTIFLILYFQFRDVPVTLLVFSGIFVAWSGGFIMIWLYAQSWFFNFELLGMNMRDLFQMGPMNLSVAVWVGFLALFGIASDDGVIMATYIQQRLREDSPRSRQDLVESVVEAGKRRIRPALMTVATTILALLPVLTSTGRGSDVMVPMAIPTFGGMTVALLSVLVVPVVYFSLEERRLKLAGPGEPSSSGEILRDTASDGVSS